MTRDPYAVLGIEPEASDAELKAAWRARLQTHHPDRAWQDGDAAVEAAEAAAKRINEAYAEIKRRRAEGEPEPPRGPTTRATRIRRRPAQPEAPVDARDALRRAQVAVEMADTLCARWKRHAAAVRAARKGALEAHATATAAAAIVVELRHAAVAERDSLLAGLADAVAALAAAPLAAARAAEDAAGRALDPAAPPDPARRAAAATAIERHRRAAAAPIDAADVAARAQALHPAARRRADAAAAHAGKCDRHVQIAAGAARRGRDAHTRARRAIDQLGTAVTEAGAAVHRAQVAAATAAGLCDVDLRHAADEQDRFVAHRACAEADAHRDAAARLEADQQQVIAAVAVVPERRAEISALAERAEDAAREARGAADIAAAAAAEARALADGTAAGLVARVEAALTAARDRITAAARAVAG